MLHRVRGDFLKDAGLLKAGLVFVPKSAPARAGNIVVGIVDDQFTYKPLAQDARGSLFLKPLNLAYASVGCRASWSSLDA